MNRTETYRPTQDDWHPNFEGNTVRVSQLTELNRKGEIWYRVCVWGSDDDGMEIDFFGEMKKFLLKKCINK